MDTLAEVQQLIASTLEVPATTVHAESKASDFAEWDSLRHLILVMELEQKFNCKFALEEIGALDSVDKIVKMVQKRAEA